MKLSVMQSRWALLALGLVCGHLPVNAQSQAGAIGPLCDEPECPEAVDIPPNYGIEDRCGDEADLTTGKDVLEGGTINTGKRFKPGVFTIEQVEQKSTYDWTTAGEDGWNYFRLGRITYTVKCKNGITYRDTYTWGQADQYDVNYITPEDGVDHFCSVWSQTFDACSRGGSHDDIFRPVIPVEYDEGTRVIAPIGSFSKDLKLPIGRIVKKWLNRKVGLPVYYGGVNTLAVPVILVHGLGLDYRSMGAMPAGGVGTEEWRKGLVKGYVPGSLPDILSRAYGLAKGADINRNGIYFLNLDPSLLASNEQDLIWTLERLGQIVLDYVGTKPLSSTFKMDIVCHSTGCSLIKEALAQANRLPPQAGFLNPANYIRRIVTVNAPLQGTGLAKSNEDLAGRPEYQGLPELVGEIENANADQGLVHGRIKLDLSEIAYEECGGGFLGAMCWIPGQYHDAKVELNELLRDEELDEYTFDVKGTLLGPYSIESPWLSKTLSNGQSTARETFTAKRRQLINLQNVFFGPGYVPGRLSEYPRRSDGTYIEIVPYYSENNGGLSEGLARGISEEVFTRVCAGDNSSKCNLLQSFLRFNGQEELTAALTGARPASIFHGAVELTVDQRFHNMQKALREGWLKNSDMLVEASSQQWSLKNGQRDENGNRLVELNPARTYVLHYAAVPEGHPSRPVLHAPLAQFSDTPLPVYLSALSSGASLQGRDLFCGLDATCSELMGRNRPVMYAGAAVRRLMPSLLASGQAAAEEIYTQTVRLQGDFDLYPQILCGDKTGVAIQDEAGQNIAVVVYDPAVGTFVWRANGQGGSIEIVLPAERRPQFTVQRLGGEIRVTLGTQDGAKKNIALTTVAEPIIKFVALGDGLASNPVLLVGDAVTVDAEAAKPPVAWGQVRPILVEKGQKELNQSRPWVWMTNSSESVQKNLVASYYFTADPARTPVVEIDYPRDVVFAQKRLGGNLWALEIQVPELPVKQAWPESGLQIRLHYADWSEWPKADDPSLGEILPIFSEKIVVRDALGRVIWGQEPTATVVSSEETTPPPATTPEVTAIWSEGATTEANVLRPRVTLKNTSAVPLPAGYRVNLKIVGLPGTETPVLEGFWHPGVTAAIRREATGEVVVDWTFAPAALEPGLESSIGQWSLHLANFVDLHKAGLSYEITVLDAQGNVLAHQVQGSTGSTPPPPSAIRLGASWSDASPYEANMLRPQGTVKNLDQIALSKGYRVRLRIDGLTGTELLVLEGYYHPGVTGAARREANGQTVIEWTFADDLQPAQQVGLGQWGLHFANWRSLEKATLTYTVSVLDASGAEVLGNAEVTR